jgi:hypothetical protein
MPTVLRNVWQRRNRPARRGFLGHPAVLSGTSLPVVISIRRRSEVLPIHVLRPAASLFHDPNGTALVDLEIGDQWDSTYPVSAKFPSASHSLHLPWIKRHDLVGVCTSGITWR